MTWSHVTCIDSNRGQMCVCIYIYINNQVRENRGDVVVVFHKLCVMSLSRR